MPRKVKVAAAQMEIISGDYEGNLENALKMMKEAARNSADFVCLPEFFSTGIPIFKEEPIPGPTTDFLCEKARKLNINIVGGTIREKREGKIYNTCCLISRKGEILANYSKIHLWIKEQGYVTPGKEWVVVETDICKVGLLICWDSWFCESARILALQGAEIVFCPTWVEAWGGKKGVPEDRRNLGKVRAGENLFFFVDVVSCGKIKLPEVGKMRLAGHSRIFGPGERMMAQVYAEAGYEPELLIAELDLDLIEKKREEFKIFQTRCKEVYKDICRL
jgi:omega-amidase